MLVGRKSCWRQLQASFFRLLCLIPTGFPVRSVDMQRATDNITVRQGDTAIIRCYVDDKASRVAWLNRSNIIFAGEDKWSLDPRVDLVTKGQLEYSLRIQKVDVYDEGSYTCSIQTKKQSKPSLIYLIVQVPANIYKMSEDMTVNEGSNVTLSCLASGRPDPLITWRLLNPSAEPLDGEEYLDIVGIMRTQAGRYECKASNDVATPDVKYVNVIVNYPPTIKRTQSSEAQLGRTGTLLCEATAVPTPEFEWFRDDKRLSNIEDISIQVLGTSTILMIANVAEEDYGKYTCVASNRLGVQNSSVFLYRPGTGRDISGAACVSQSLWLLLACITCLLFKC
ncbi:limbic system-associated membrane protein isoform X1 [Corythoichthys intestinalis]|uniref:limbic system-associated membrane protein isoform X1 n=1 Tax=Corythoichthys intestinalis TaxID=161448 RepID=UPI0025A582CD|nr:limbic system-associated membrane protein isoform X1 [Corythoichthys intestinalis]XP_061797146.1 limbic system-associated membrane protein-like [Nerophis lumbriciformis]